MFHYITQSRYLFVKRYWLRKIERTAAQNHHQWPQLAATCDFAEFRSFAQLGHTVYTYAGVEIGKTQNERHQINHDTLSPFMHSLRTIVITYYRMYKFATDLRNQSPPVGPRQIQLSSAEQHMLCSHPQYRALVEALESEGIPIRLICTRSDGLYTFVLPQ